MNLYSAAFCLITLCHWFKLWRGHRQINKKERKLNATSCALGWKNTDPISQCEETLVWITFLKRKQKKEAENVAFYWTVILISSDIFQKAPEWDSCLNNIWGFCFVFFLFRFGFFFYSTTISQQIKKSSSFGSLSAHFIKSTWPKP